MTLRAQLATLVCTGSLLLAGASAPALAASLMTTAFVANVRPNVDFLDRSSRMALDHSNNGAIRSFAHSEAIDQTITANQIVAWTQTNTVPGAVVAVGPVVTPVVPVAPVADVVVAPVDTAAAVATDTVAATTGVVTGRSVAIDDPLVVTPRSRVVAAETAAPLLPAGEEDLARLSTRQGRQFDALYRTSQRSALRQLVTLYTDYIQNGDDPALRSMAARELPKIKLRLTELRRL